MQRSRKLTASFGMAFLATISLLLGCGASSSAPEEPSSIAPVSRKTGVQSIESESKSEARQIHVADVPGGALGPRLVSTKQAQVLVWAVPGGEAPGLFSVAVVDGEATAARRIAPVDPSARQLNVGVDDSGDILATLVHRVGENDVLSATRLGLQGEVRSEAVVAATTPGHILYTRVVRTAIGAVIVWVEKAGRSADLYSVVFDSKGPRRPTRIIRQISSWQVVSREGALTVVTREGGRLGSIQLRQLGDGGQVIGTPIELARDVLGGVDLDVAVTRDQILVAWSEGTGQQSRLVGTLLDASGNVLATPASLTAARGQQALLGLVASPSGSDIWALWEEPRHAPHGRNFVFLGAFDPTNQQVAPEYEFRPARKDPLLPAFAISQDRVNFLSDVDGGERIAGVIGSGSSPIRSETIRSRLGKKVVMAWDLQCQSAGCRYLMATEGSPASVFLSEVAPVSPSKTVVRSSSEFPRVTGHETLGEVPEPARLTGANTGGDDLLAWVSYFDPDHPYVVPTQPAPDGRRAPVRAKLTTVSVGETETGPRLSETVVSYRARSLGGVALVAPKNNRGLLAWAALDGGDPQLFATVVDDQGKKIRQKMLTRSVGEVTDATAVRVSGGYLLAWVDGRSGRSEVYGLRVSDSLVPVGKPRQISHGARSPSGVTLLADSGTVTCVWADARSTGGTGNAALFVVDVDPASAKPRGAERSLTDPLRHGHSPQLFVGPDDSPWVVWSSEPQAGERPDRKSAVHFAPLPKDGDLETVVWELPGTATGVNVDCQQGYCSAVAVVSLRDDQGGALVSLHGARIRKSETGIQLSAAYLLPLWTTIPEAVSPVLRGDSLYFADQGSTREGWKLRRALVEWNPTAKK